MTKSDWIKNFWIKALAFLLAVAVVPLMILYGIAFLYTYSEGLYRAPSPNFYKTELCSSAVYQEAGPLFWSDWLADLLERYPVEAAPGSDTKTFGEVMGEYFPADETSNLRLTAYQDETVLLYSNVGEEDVYITSYENADGISFQLYVTANILAHDRIQWAKDFYDRMLPLSTHSVAIFTALALAEIFLLIFLLK